ncbi:EAL domain-containing protein [Azospirillum sp. ST 5-10]|uniref:EAL domain-containing protein n=1 Tax=unclassified Azospirillum TaxID=2630922 RepID=UPI003F4A811C
MNRFSLSAGLAFALAMTVAAGLLVFMADRGADARRHAEALATLDRLGHVETSLDRDLLEVVAGILAHYDTLVQHAGALHTLGDRLAAAPADFPPELTEAYRRRVAAKLDAAERIKGTAAFVRNEVNYLPFQIARYGERGRPDVTRRLQQALIGELAGAPPDDGGALAAAIDDGDGLGHVTMHLRALREQRRALTQAIDAYFAIDAHAALERLRGRYLAGYAERQWWSRTITAVLGGLTLLLFGGLGWSILRLGIAHARVRESEARFSTIFQASPEPVAIVDWADGTIVDVNGAFERATAFSRGEVLGRPFRTVAPDGDGGGDGGGGDEAVPTAGLPAGGETRFLRKDGGDFTALASVDLARIAGRTCGIVVARDITDRIAAERNARMADSVFESAHEGIIITDADGTILRVNPAFSRITGYAPAEVVGANPRLLNSGRHDRTFYRDLWTTITTAGHWTGEVWNRRKNGEVYPEWLSISAVRDAAGTVGRFVAVFTDISTVKHQEEALRRLAHHDALTGLPNRVLLADRMDLAIARARRAGKTVAVCYLDLDGFKPVNDGHGHVAGDALLIEVARRIAAVLRSGDTLARLGGDEFVVLLPDRDGAEECGAALARVLAAVAEPAPLPGRDAEVRVTASIGVSLFPDDEGDPDTLLRHADQAMVQAKQAGRNRYQFYDADRDNRVQAYRETVAALRHAIDAGQFTLFYQPKVNMRLGQVIGAEALIRWNHPERGLLLPGDFLPLVEESGLEVAMGEWVVAAALAQMTTWQGAGIGLPISVNITARHLLCQDFAERLGALLAAHPDLPPDRLQLEVLETAALEDIARARAVLRSCRELGVSLALDDFGTGYSSLTYLRHLPVQTLKIDQSFVRNLPHDPEDLAIVESVIVLAKALNRTVLAEGVESAEHGRRLLDLGCELAQGYGISRPMPANDLPGWLPSWRPHACWTGGERVPA